MREFDLIARLAAHPRGLASHPRGSASYARHPHDSASAQDPHPRDDVVLGIGDDAALLAPAPGMQLVACTDTLVRGVHYPVDTPPADIGWKALAVNLSDLAAMGATPRWALLALTLPEVQEAWVEAFLDGWCALAGSCGIVLVGGDTTRGPETVTVTVLGEVPSGAALRRAGAVAGDRIWVSGTLGDAAAALEQWRAATDPRGDGHGVGPGRIPSDHASLAGASETHPMGWGDQSVGASETHPMGSRGESVGSRDESVDASAIPPTVRPEVSKGEPAPVPQRSALALRLARPTPRLALGRALRPIATACIDVSDGLLADLGHLATASGIAAEVHLAALPVSDALAAWLPAAERWPLQLAGGDDYELCFTAAASRDAEVQALAAGSGVALTAIGRIVVGSGVRVLHADGREYHPPRRGYEHFA